MKACLEEAKTVLSAFHQCHSTFLFPAPTPDFGCIFSGTMGFRVLQCFIFLTPSGCGCTRVGYLSAWHMFKWGCGLEKYGMIVAES